MAPTSHGMEPPANPGRFREVFDRLLGEEAAGLRNSMAQLISQRDEAHRHSVGQPKPPSSSPQPNARRQSSWWRRQSQAFRQFAFVSFVWALAVLVYVAVFDPFNAGDPTCIDGSEWARVIAVAALPIVVGGLKWAYDKLVR